DDGRRARLVLRPGRALARDVRAAQLLVRSQGRARGGAHERRRARLLDRAQDDARGAHADGRRARQRHTVALRGRRRGARLAQERSGQGAGDDAAARVFTLAALQVLPRLELLDRRRRRGAGDTEAVQARDGDPRPHAPGADQPHRQHRLSRHVVDGVAVAVCAVGAAGADGADGPRRSVRSVRRLRQRAHACLRGRARRQDLQPVGPQPDDGARELPGLERRARSSVGDAAAELLMEVTTMRAIAIALVGACCCVGASARGDERPHHTLPKAQHGGTVVGLCDGETSTEVAVPPGQALSHDEAQRVSDQLMAEWRRKHPDAHWDAAVAQQTTQGSGTAKNRGGQPSTTHDVAPETTSRPTTATKTPAGTQPREQTGTYSAYDARDELVWKTEVQKFIAEGNALFHDAKK